MKSATKHDMRYLNVCCIM